MIKGKKAYGRITNTWSTGYWVPIYQGNTIVQYVPVWKEVKE